MTTENSTVLEPQDVLVIADDLAGAAESAAALTAASGIPSELRLEVGETRDAEATVLVIDTDSRYATASDARAAVRAAVSARPHARLIIKKVDSLLRGRVADETAALRDRGITPIASFALPSMRRTVTGGVVHLDGVPLQRTDTWGAEKTPPPTSIPQLLDGIPTRVISLTTVRNGSLDEHLLDALTTGTVPVCDAEEQTDLDAVADAALRLTSRIGQVGIMGTGAIARAVGRRLQPAEAKATHTARTQPPAVLAVVGTVAATISEQLRILIDAGASAIAISPEQLAQPGFSADLVSRISDGLRGGVVVVYTDRTAQWHRDDVAVLASSLRDLPELGAVDLVLTGGETARRVLDAARVTTMYPERELADGVVLSRTASGCSVVTRPGSFGTANSLRDIVAYLRPPFRSSQDLHI
jgi:4-hydroxythreonine-4-phosphate dehydrogenase